MALIRFIVPVKKHEWVIYKNLFLFSVVIHVTNHAFLTQIFFYAIMKDN